MSFQLRLDEMLCVLEDIQHPRAAELIAAVERLGNVVIEEICATLAIVPGVAAFDMGFVAAPVFAVEDGQDLPPAIRGYDTADEWGSQASMRI